MMRILFAIGSLNWGGAQRVASHIIRHWLERGHQVTVLVTYSGRETRWVDLPNGAEVVLLADLVGTTRPGILSIPRRLRALRRYLAAERPDRILSFLTDCNIAVLAASAGLGLDIVVSERSYPPRDRLPLIYRAARRLLYPWSRCVVLQSAKSVAWMDRAIPRARGEVIFNPVSLPLAVSNPVLPPASYVAPVSPVILSLGRLEAEKQLGLLLSAFAKLAARRPDWVLVIAGDGSQEAALRARIADLGLVHRVVLLGAVGNPADWYRRAEIFCLTSSYEGFPNALLEAMAHGCACIALDCATGPSEMIEHGVNGLLMPTTTEVAALANAIDGLASNATLRRSLGDAACGVAWRFSFEKIMADWDRTVLGYDRS